MEYRGTVRSGVIVLEGGADLPDGTPVRVTADEAPPRPPQAEPAAGSPLGERLLRFAGCLTRDPGTGLLVVNCPPDAPVHSMDEERIQALVDKAM